MDILLSPTTIAWLLFAAFAAGFLDALAGGGGLITLPALLAAGLPPVNALATNKLQAVFGVATSSATVLRQKTISLDDVRSLVVFSFLGSAAGAWVIQRIDTSVLNAVLPVALGSIAIYFLFVRNAGRTTTEARISYRLYQRGLVPLIGFYDGAIGPGTGSLFATAGVSLRGLDLVKATARAKPLNFASNLAALLLFLAGGAVIWQAGLVMIGGQALGSYLGTHTMLRGGSRLIRPMIVLAATAMLAKYFGLL
ncbi:Transmembrane protein YfcA [hydrothermal vent metagenome]|uniref:Transmembrane protein YfcA n=1 Tax=hydrothermal vent metagenome TaxID=652676 RepID=A0A3B0T366_9ZZZZ